MCIKAKSKRKLLRLKLSVKYIPNTNENKSEIIYSKAEIKKAPFIMIKCITLNEPSIIMMKCITATDNRLTRLEIYSFMSRQMTEIFLTVLTAVSSVFNPNFLGQNIKCSVNSPLPLKAIQYNGCRNRLSARCLTSNLNFTTYFPSEFRQFT